MRLQQFTLISLFLLVALPINVIAADVTVSNNSELDTALTNANAGDTINLNPGNYGAFTTKDLPFSSTVRIKSSSLNGAVFTHFKIENSTHITVEGIRIEQSASTNYGFQVVESANITLARSTIYGEDFMSGKNIFLVNVTDVNILDNDISTTNDGIHTTGTITNLTIEGNKIITREEFVNSSAHDDSIQFRSTVINLKILRNLLAYSDQNIFMQTTKIGAPPADGVIISGNISLQRGDDFEGKHVDLQTAHNVTIEGNTFSTYGGGYAHGIVVGHSGDYIVKGNIFSNSLYQSKASGTDSDYNLFYDTSSKQVITGYSSLADYRAANPTSDVHSIEGNPLFVDEENTNARLQALSPAINAGIPLSSITLDIDGNTRPAGTAWDIGAHEFGAGASTLEAPRNFRLVQ